MLIEGMLIEGFDCSCIPLIIVFICNIFNICFRFQISYLQLHAGHVFTGVLVGHLYTDNFFIGPVLFYVVDLRYVIHS